MKKRNFLWGCVTALVFLFLLAIGGGWLYFRPQLPSTDAPPPSTVLVFLTTPDNGDEVTAGDFVPVMVKATASTKILSAELFVDDSDILEFLPPAPLTNTQCIKIVTTQSPSWVAWREIEIESE